ncbi:RNA binding protein, heterogenous nuclear RNP-K like protein, partial [Entomortierella beljakovae]
MSSSTTAVSGAKDSNDYDMQYDTEVDPTHENERLDPDSPLTLRAIVSTKEAGVIIGKGGKNVADLRDQTGVKAG